ncbi:MAG: hypothetical protein BGO01_20590 [Armatimonadetes bacterium 55-13]|nr:hypothetical protein [Armatimonadota bacterium]OJU64510.1 MAG: hypothetical protein BGO01_20590 [Armatimonadetes bacterium 55-13]
MPAGGPTQFDQRHARFANDDGTADPATWSAAEDVDISASLDTNIRLRFVISDTAVGAGISPPPGVVQLQYSKNGGSYNNVTGASTNVRASLSSHFADGDTITRQLTQYGSNTFASVGAWETTGVSSSVFMAPGSDNEVEFCFQLRSADVSPGDTFDFKLIYGGFALTAYSKIPRVTASGGSAENISFSNAQAFTATDSLSTPGFYEETVSFGNAQFFSIEGPPPVSGTETVSFNNGIGWANNSSIAISESLAFKNAQRLVAISAYTPGGSIAYEFLSFLQGHRFASSSSIATTETPSFKNGQIFGGSSSIEITDTVEFQNAQRVEQSEAGAWITSASFSNAHRLGSADLIRAVETPILKHGGRFTLTAPISVVDAVSFKNGGQFSLDTGFTVTETISVRHGGQFLSPADVIITPASGSVRNAHGVGVIDLAKLVSQATFAQAHSLTASETRNNIETIGFSMGHQLGGVEAVAHVNSVEFRNGQGLAVVSRSNHRGLIPAIRYNIKSVFPGLTGIPEALPDGTVGEELKLDYAVIVAKSPSEIDLAVQDVAHVVPVDIVIVRKTLAGIDNAQRQREELFALQQRILADYQMFGETPEASAYETRVVSTPYDRRNEYQQRFASQHKQREITISVLSIECYIEDSLVL